MSRGQDMLERRDPMLAHAVSLHGHEWIAGVETMLDGNEDGLPAVVIQTLSHSLRWRTPTDTVTINASWDSTTRRWCATLVMTRELPQSVVTMLQGRPLADVVDLPKAAAWTIEGASDFGGETHYMLRRSRTTA